MATSSKNTTVDFPFLFSVIVLSLSAFFSWPWPLIPVAMATLYRTNKRQFLPLVAFLSVFLIGRQAWRVGELDLLMLVTLVLMGVVLMKATRRSHQRFVRWMVPMSLYLSASLVLVGLSAWFLGHSEGLLSWAYTEVEILTSTERLTQDLGIREEGLLRIHANALIGAYGGALYLLFFTNLVFDGFLQSLRQFARSKRLAKTSIWDSFSEWKTPDLALFALVGGFGLLVLQVQVFETSLLTLDPLNALGWSTVVWAAFCYILDGLAVSAYYLQRVGLPFKLLIIFLIFYLTIPFLALVGLGDLCFDFRARIGSRQDDSDSDSG